MAILPAVSNLAANPGIRALSFPAILLIPLPIPATPGISLLASHRLDKLAAPLPKNLAMPMAPWAP